MRMIFGGGLSKVIPFVVLGVLLIGPYWCTREVINLLILAAFYSYLNLCWNLISGYGGQLSLGHTVFFGVGAYTSTLLFSWYNVSPWTGMLLGAALSGCLGYIVSIITFSLKIKGIAFSLATLALNEIFFGLFISWDKTVGGIYLPFKNDPLSFVFTNRLPYYYIILLAVLFVLVFSKKIEKKKFGRYLAAIREEEDAAEAIGVDSTKYKTRAMVISAVLTAFAGTFYAQFFLYIEPELVFSLELTVTILLGAIVGGMGTVWGPIIGGCFYVALSQGVSLIPIGTARAGALTMIIYSSILGAVVLFMPLGIMGFVRKVLRPS